MREEERKGAKRDSLKGTKECTFLSHTAFPAVYLIIYRL